MVISDENNSALVGPTASKGGSEIGGRKFGVEVRHNRRVLGLPSQNQNLHGAQPVANKRVFSEANKVCDKNPPQHRPITRKFAEQIASTKRPCIEESKCFTVWEDIPLTDVEEQKAAMDHPVPMSLERIEAVLDQNDQMEVEMEDSSEELILDIDSLDSRDPLAVVDYVDDLYAYYKKTENCSCVSPNYMSQQFDINEKMRAILIDWLIEVHHKFDLREETLFLTVNLIDRFLAQQAVVRKKLQLVGLVAMLLACKYEEVSVPVVDDLVFISDKAYTSKEVLEMEKLMLNSLQFNMSVPTPYVFITRYLKAAQSDKKLKLVAFFLIELCLVESEMLKFPPSLLAAAAVYTAHCTLYGFKQWSKTCEWHTNYSEDQLLECSRMIVGLHQNASTGRLTGVYRKYCTSKFGFAAKFDPAHFLLAEAQQ
ncbi:hypothetical protein NMG60_11007754 [Bertholletia excelsa]